MLPLLTPLNVEKEEYHTKERKSNKQACEKENYEIVRSTKEKQAQEGWRRVAMGPEVNLRCVLLGAERGKKTKVRERVRWGGS